MVRQGTLEELVESEAELAPVPVVFRDPVVVPALTLPPLFPLLSLQQERQKLFLKRRVNEWLVDLTCS